MLGRSCCCWPCQAATVRSTGRQSGGLQAASPRGMGPGPRGGSGGQPTPPSVPELQSKASGLISGSWHPHSRGSRWAEGCPESQSFSQAVLRAGTFPGRSRAGLQDDEKEASPGWAPARRLWGPCPVMLLRYVPAGGDGVPRRTGEALSARFRIPPCFWVRLLQEAQVPVGS